MGFAIPALWALRLTRKSRCGVPHSGTAHKLRPAAKAPTLPEKRCAFLTIY